MSVFYNTNPSIILRKNFGTNIVTERGSSSKIYKEIQSLVNLKITRPLIYQGQKLLLVLVLPLVFQQQLIIKRNSAGTFKALKKYLKECLKVVCQIINHEKQEQIERKTNECLTSSEGLECVLKSQLSIRSKWARSPVSCCVRCMDGASPQIQPTSLSVSFTFQINAAEKVFILVCRVLLLFFLYSFIFYSLSFHFNHQLFTDPPQLV